MAQFKHHIRLSMKEEWNKHDIKGVITVLDKAIANIFEPREDGTAVVYHMLDDFHVYDFRMNRAVTEAEARWASGGPCATMAPPCTPAPGPMSTRWSAASIMSSSCSTTMTELPASRRAQRLSINLRLSLW